MPSGPPPVFQVQCKACLERQRALRNGGKAPVSRERAASTGRSPPAAERYARGGLGQGMSKRPAST